MKNHWNDLYKDIALKLLAVTLSCNKFKTNILEKDRMNKKGYPIKDLIQGTAELAWSLDGVASKKR